MCIMLAKPADCKFVKEHLREGYSDNKHGTGIAVACGGKIVIRKWPVKDFDFEQFWEELIAYEQYPCLVHFRLATHGSKNLDNTHPFLVEGPDRHYAMAHNGIINRVNCLHDESDTRAFIRTSIQPYLEKAPDLIENEHWIKWAESVIGWSKLAFLRNDGEFFFVNKCDGHMENGCWWSNRGYLPWIPTHRVHTSQSVSDELEEREAEAWLAEHRQKQLAKKQYDEAGIEMEMRDRAEQFYENSDPVIITEADLKCVVCGMNCYDSFVMCRTNMNCCCAYCWGEYIGEEIPMSDEELEETEEVDDCEQEERAAIASEDSVDVAIPETLGDADKELFPVD